MARTMPAWDGSFLGSFTAAQVLIRQKVSEHTNLKRRYFRLRLPEDEFVASAHSTKTPSFVCWVDELKPLFGIEKHGTHRIILDGKHWLLVKPIFLKTGDIWEGEPTLDQFTAVHSDLFIQAVRQIFVFRDAFALSRTSEQAILYHSFIVPNTYPPKTSHRPKSIKETGHLITELKEGKSVLSERLLATWFQCGSPAQVLAKMVGLKPEFTKGDLSRRLGELYTKMERETRRIDGSFLPTLRLIQARIATQLQTP